MTSDEKRYVAKLETEISLFLRPYLEIDPEDSRDKYSAIRNANVIAHLLVRGFEVPGVGTIMVVEPSRRRGTSDPLFRQVTP